MYKIIRALLFLRDPEKVHYSTTKLLRKTLNYNQARKWWRKKYVATDPLLKTSLFGLDFNNPVGLAAGFDKNATSYPDLADCGFGFIEIGTVTPRPQAGNPKPRLFRLKKDEAIINRMGFNNDGVDLVAERLKNRKLDVIIGGNIGKNKDTDNEDAFKDYEMCFIGLFPWVDYFVVNVSSPNTPNLRDLQEKEPLKALLNHLQDINGKQTHQRPILLKIAPDLTNEQLDDIIEIVRETKISGVIATNTTISRDNLRADKSEIEKIGAGGLSGKPLRNRSTEVIRYLHDTSGGAFPIIGVGGIHTAQDAIEKLEAGASLIQLYTGFIYEGPQLVKDINDAIISWRKEKSAK